MNLVMMLGRLTRDPKVGTGQGGGKYATFSIAVDRSYSGKDGGKDEADFFDCIAFNRKNGSQNADTAEKYLKQGKPIIVRGELQNSHWTDAQGNKRVSAQIIVDRIQFLPLPGKGQDESAETAEGAPVTAAASAPAPAAEEEADVWNDIQ